MKNEFKLFCFCLESLISRRYIEYKKSMVIYIYINNMIWLRTQNQYTLYLINDRRLYRLGKQKCNRLEVDLNKT